MRTECKASNIEYLFADSSFIPLTTLIILEILKYQKRHQNTIKIK